MRSTDRFLVKHGVEAVCVHCGTDLSFQSLFGSYVDNGNDKDADPDSMSAETTLNTSDQKGSSNGQTRTQSPVDSGGDELQSIYWCDLGENQRDQGWQLHRQVSTGRCYKEILYS